MEAGHSPRTSGRCWPGVDGRRRVTDARGGRGRGEGEKKGEEADARRSQCCDLLVLHGQRGGARDRPAEPLRGGGEEGGRGREGRERAGVGRRFVSSTERKGKKKGGDD